MPYPSSWLATVHVLTALTAAVGIPVTGASASAADAAKNDKLPEFEAVKQTVLRQLKSRKHYRPGDMLSRDDVKTALDAVQQLGWDVDDRTQILADVLPKKDFLVRQLRSRRGLPFMRRLSGTPGTYDRMDRLRRMPFGRRRIRELIHNPGGYTLILYMVTTSGGRQMGRFLSETPTGRNFNKPTGRIYTENDLLKRLKQSYAAERKQRSLAESPGRD